MRLLGIILSLFLLAFSIYAEDQVKHGSIEISDPEKVYNLTGDWKFQSGKVKDAYKKDFDDSAWGLFPVPSIWLYKNVSNIKNGWYRVHIKISSELEGEPLGFITPNIQEAHRLYFNGVLIGRSGEIDQNGNLKKQDSKSDLFLIKPDLISYGKENILAIEVANYRGGFGGIQNIPYLGIWELTKKKFYRNLMWISSICFLLIILGIYHFILFLGQRNEKSFFYYSQLSFSLAFFTLVNYKINLWVNESFTLQYILFTLSLGLIGILLYLLAKSLFDEPIDRLTNIILRAYLLFLIVHVFCILNEDWLVFRNVYLMRVTVCLSSIFSFLPFAIIFRSILSRKPSAKIILLGYVTASPFFLIDVLRTLNVIKIQPWFISEGSIILMLTYAYGIAVKNAKTYEKLIQIQKGYKENLQIQVIQKTKELADTNEALLKADELKNRVFSVISHDLRSPLDTLNDIIFLFQNKRYTKEKLKKNLDDLSLNLKRNRFLLGNLLNWSSSQLGENGNQQASKVDMKKVLMETMEFLIPSARKKLIQIKATRIEKSYGLGNMNTFRVIFMNIITNAIKFTNRGGEVKVGVEVKDTWCIVTISDTGIGMTEEQIRKVISKEEIISTQGTEREQGSGIGLKLCVDFIEKMKGKLEIESIPEKGSTFKIFIPTLEELS